ncbi:Bilin biosynthesis protein PecE [Methanoculleus chikugoensis]|uniref:Bilin biosynthesis protein PecE n=1 Tax=Methanoculleus chikugoensis TaxID=118126 RepID=A0A1M4MK70_9EURY|nr:HEAT repeat domain-containing protein [Methanoculleus chikugoensis]SCL75293.1 Bilin biosynthesis protein PecE [Methanoculleus chikugoensis]
MAFFDKFRTKIDGLQQAKDYPGLVAVLNGEDPGNRADAARALAVLGVPAIPDILRALERARPASRTRMIESLVSVGAPSIPLLLALVLQASPDLQASISRTIAEAENSMAEMLMPALHHEQPAIRRATVIALQGVGRRMIPPLTKALGDANLSVRREAANVLASMQWSPEDVPEKVRFYYIREDWKELAKLQGAAVPVLLKALGSENPRIRSESARTLGKIRDARVVPPLIKAVKDPQPEVRIRVIEALGEVGDDRAKPPLADALSDPHHQVRMEAAWALGKLGWVPQSDLQRAEYLIAGERWKDLIRMGRPAIPPLIRALGIGYSGVRTGASEALRQLGQPALNALNMEASSKDPARKRQALAALEYIRQRQKEATLTQPALEDKSRYSEELKEGLAIQKRFEKQFGRPNYAPNEPAKKPPAPAREETPEIPVEQTQEEPKAPVSLSDLIQESRQAEAAWAQVKARWKVDIPAASGGAIQLDQLIPIEFEQEIVETGEAGEEEQFAYRPEEEDREPQELDIPIIAKDTVEPPEPPEPLPEKTPLEKCLEALRSSDASIRAAAVAALQGMGKEAVGYIIETLTDPHYGVRIAAAEALGEIGEADAVEALIQALGDAREDVRIAVISALGRIGDRRAVDPLIHLFRDRYHGVRVAAADAVAEFGRGALRELEEALDDPLPVVRVTAAKAIGLIGATESVPVLITHLGDSAPDVRWSVARALSTFDAMAIEPLFLVLRTGNKEMRLAAIDALWEIPDEGAGDVLRYALDDRDEEVRTRAAAALRKRQVIDVWRRTLGSQVEEEERTSKKTRKVRVEDKKAFEQSGQENIDTLIGALKDKDWQAQLSAATRLIMMGRPAVDALIHALRGEDSEIRSAAASILGDMREAAVTPLMDALRDSDRYVRIVAARNLGQIGNKRAIEALLGSLHQDHDIEVRTTVAEALGYIGSKEAIEPLALALRDRDEGVKIAAARSLGYIGDLNALEPLVLALHDVDDRVRYAALEALKDPGETMRRHLIGALRSGDETFRAGVAEALEAGGWRPETGEERTLHLMAQGRWAEVERVGADALPVLAEALSDPLIEVRTNAVRAIDRIGGEGAVVPLIQALKDDALAVRKRAEWALIQMGKVALPALDLAESEEEQPGIRERLQRIAREIRAKEGS